MSALRPYQVALLTGPSDWGRWALSPIQDAFLHSLKVPEEALVLFNFPYGPNSLSYRPVPILKASLCNAGAYIRSRRLAFRLTYGPVINAFLARAERTVLVTGSCGLELFNNLRLSSPALAGISVFAYGPVARTRPACRHLLVSGRKDFMTRFCFPKPDRLIDCTHLAYLSNPVLRDLCTVFVADAIRAASPADLPT